MSLNTASTKPGATFINTSERVAYQTPLLTPTRFGSSTAVEKPAPNPILFKDCGAVPLHCRPGCGVLWSWKPEQRRLQGMGLKHLADGGLLLIYEAPAKSPWRGNTAYPARCVPKSLDYLPDVQTSNLKLKP